MPSPEVAESIALSREFFENPGSYGGFSLTRDKKNIIGCIEPKDPEDDEHGYYKTIIQTGGGGAGEGLDNALALAVVEGQLVTVEEAMRRDKDDRHLTVIGGHYRCAFIGGVLAVVEEMSDPSEPTLNNVERWAQALHHEEVLNKSFMGAIKEAAKRKQEHLQLRGRMDHLVDYLGELYPEHANVGHVRGDGPAHVYVTNLHPNVGQNRNKKSQDPEQALKVRGYHDSLAASVVDIEKAMNLSRRVRGLRVTSMFLRSAATRTVIAGDRAQDMAFLEVRPADTPSGLEVVEDTFSV